MKKGSRFALLTLALVMLLGTFAACKNDKPAPTPGNSTASSTNGEPSGEPGTDTEPAVETDENGYVKDNIPADVDYHDKELNVLWWKLSADRTVPDGDVSNSKDEVLKKSYYQMVELESRLNINLNVIREEGGWGAGATFMAKARNAGENGYDLICSYSLWPSALASEDLLVDLKKLSNPDLDKPWWPESTEEWSQYGKLFFVSSNSSLTALQSMEVMFCNSKMFTDRSLEDPIDLALEGKWTVDRMLELVKEFEGDLAEDDPSHVYGLTIDDFSRLDALVYGAGFTTTRNNSDGVAEMSFTNPSESQRLSDFIDKLIPVFKTSAVGIASNNTNWMREHKTALMVASFEELSKMSDNDYAPLPSPKLDESQEKYAVIQNNGYDVWCVPASAQDPEISAVVIEAIASADYRGIAPFYFEKYMKLRYSADAKAGAMFELVRSSVTYNLGRMMVDTEGKFHDLGIRFRGCFWDNGVKTPNNKILDGINRKGDLWKARLTELLQTYRNSTN